VTCRLVAGQLLGKRITATTNTQATMGHFRCYATRCKYNNSGRGVFYVVLIYPLLGNGCFLCCGPTPDYVSSTAQNQRERERERERMERVLGIQGRRFRLEIDCELLQLILIPSDCKRSCQ
jgi:hypothetical protein